MRLERFINTLIPVDYVLWAEYVSKDTLLGNDYVNVTIINVLIPNTFVTIPIVIKGNKLDDFQNWFSEVMKNNPKKLGFATAMLDSEKDKEDEKQVDMSPKFCHVSTTSDGSEHITIFNGKTSAAEDVVKPPRILLK